MGSRGNDFVQRRCRAGRLGGDLQNTRVAIWLAAQAILLAATPEEIGIDSHSIANTAPWSLDPLLWAECEELLAQDSGGA